MKKNAIASKDASKKEIANLNEINLSKFADQLSGISLKEKKERETIYIYPDGFSKEIISSEKGKKFRNGLRNQMRRFANNILLFAKMNRLDDLRKEIAEFDLFYAKYYRMQDYSASSISQSNNPEKEMGFSLMMEIIKEIKSAK